MRNRRSSKPRASSTPANDSSTTNTMRWPRSRSTLAMALQLLVGPQAPGSGKNAIVLESGHLTETQRAAQALRLFLARLRRAAATGAGSAP